MKILSTDIETFSSVDLKLTGVYPYVESADFEILMCSYSVNYGPVTVCDLMLDDLPEEFVDMLLSSKVVKTAWNAAFERICLSKHLGVELPLDQWDDTMIRAARAGYPLSLDAAAKAMKLDDKKDAAGKALIAYFSKPCKPTKANGGRTRNLPEHAPQKWVEYLDYNRQDVIVEMAIRKNLDRLQTTPFETELWFLDQQVNDTGIRVDRKLVRNAIRINNEYVERIQREAAGLTGLTNPNSVPQLLGWLREQDIETDTLRKANVKDLLSSDVASEVRRVLEIRQEAAKTSVKKYAAMLHYAGGDSRVRGLFQFYGASRTGRWSGRGVQFQNLPQNHLEDLKLAREIVRSGDGELLELTFGNVPDTLSQLIRTAFVPEPGHRFIIADFSAIEARVIAWLAGEQWRLEVFRTHGKIYEASASQMFKIPIEQITKGSDLRQKGKVSELALGYGGGPGALIAMGALKMGLTEDELPELVRVWRESNQAITKLWANLNRTAFKAIEQPGYVFQAARRTKMVVKNRTLLIELPSGRCLSYLNVRTGTNRFGRKSILYQGINDKKQWGWEETYGGKLTENVVQAIARDCLGEALVRLKNAGYKIVTHVHDEAVLEVPEGFGSCKHVDKIMSMPMPWAPELPLTAESFEATFYQK